MLCFFVSNLYCSTGYLLFDNKVLNICIVKCKITFVVYGLRITNLHFFYVRFPCLVKINKLYIE